MIRHDPNRTFGATRLAAVFVASRQAEVVALADAAPVAQLGAEIMPEAEPSEPEYDFAAAYQQDDPNVSLFYRNA